MSTATVLERIERRVLNHPRAKAIVEHDDPAASLRDDKEVSTMYGDLWEKSGRMAKALSRETRGAMIGVAVNEGSALHVCQVAVLRARKTFVPISIEEGNGRRNAHRMESSEDGVSDAEASERWCGRRTCRVHKCI